MEEQVLSEKEQILYWFIYRGYHSNQIHWCKQRLELETGEVSNGLRVPVLQEEFYRNCHILKSKPPPPSLPTHPHTNPSGVYNHHGNLDFWDQEKQVQSEQHYILALTHLLSLSIPRGQAQCHRLDYGGWLSNRQGFWRGKKEPNSVNQEMVTGMCAAAETSTAMSSHQYFRPTGIDNTFLWFKCGSWQCNNRPQLPDLGQLQPRLLP